MHLIATESSHANDQVKSVMRTLKNIFTAVETSSERSWQDAIPDVQLVLNCSINRVTKSSHLELFIGEVARPLELLCPGNEDLVVDINEVKDEAVSNMENNSHYDKTRFDKTKVIVKNSRVGDFVLLKNEERYQTTFDSKYKGPFRRPKS